MSTSRCTGIHTQDMLKSIMSIGLLRYLVKLNKIFAFLLGSYVWTSDTIKTKI